MISITARLSSFQKPYKILKKKTSDYELDKTVLLWCQILQEWLSKIGRMDT